MLPLRQAEKITSDKDIESYNCYRYAIKRKTTRSPSGSGMLGYNVEKVFEGVVKDVGSENIRRLNSMNDPISDDEYMVALRVGFFDYHFMVKDQPNALPESKYRWNHKYGSGKIEEYTMYDDSTVWDFGLIAKYDSDIIYFALQKNWE